MMLGKIEGKPVIGLPGYPLAAQTVLREFAVPLLEYWGLAPILKYSVNVKLATPLSSDLGFDEFVPVSVGRIGNQHWGMARSRGTVVQMSTVRSNGYAHIPDRLKGTTRSMTWKSSSRPIRQISSGLSFFQAPSTRSLKSWVTSLMIRDSSSIREVPVTPVPSSRSNGIPAMQRR